MDQKELLTKLKESIASNSVIMGTKETVKHLKLKKVKSIIISNNIQDNIRKDIEKNWSWKKQAKNYEKVFDFLIKN